MRPTFPIAALAVFLAAGTAPAQTQTPGQPHIAPNAAAPVGNLDPAAQQNLEQLARDSVAALQASLRAADKHTDKTVELLGDHIALTQGELSRRLAALSDTAGSGGDVRLSNETTDTIQHLNGLNGRPFAEAYVTFVQDVYPRLISGLEQLSQTPGNDNLKGLVDSFLPKMREEMTAATQISQGAYEDQQLAQELERGLPLARKDFQTFSQPGNNAQGSTITPSPGEVRGGGAQ